MSKDLYTIGNAVFEGELLGQSKPPERLSPLVYEGPGVRMTPTVENFDVTRWLASSRAALIEEVRQRSLIVLEGDGLHLENWGAAEISTGLGPSSVWHLDNLGKASVVALASHDSRRRPTACAPVKMVASASRIERPMIFGNRDLDADAIAVFLNYYSLMNLIPHCTEQDSDALWLEKILQAVNERLIAQQQLYEHWWTNSLSVLFINNDRESPHAMAHCGDPRRLLRSWRGALYRQLIEDRRPSVVHSA